MKTEKLKPCPFCGNKAKLEENEIFGGCYEVSCTNLKCDAFVTDDSESDVIRKWNIRHDELTIKKLILFIINIFVCSFAFACLLAIAYQICLFFKP